MAERFGKVISLRIPRPIQHFDLESVPTRVKGLGYVYIEYENVEVARRARKQFVTKMFSERSVACGYFEPDRYKNGELDIADKVIINF
jgi:splicing factor U2AF subunit